MSDELERKQEITEIFTLCQFVDEVFKDDVIIVRCYLFQSDNKGK